MVSSSAGANVELVPHFDQIFLNYKNIKRKYLEKIIENVWEVASGQQLCGGEWPRMVVTAGCPDKATPRSPLMKTMMILLKTKMMMMMPG